MSLNVFHSGDASDDFFSERVMVMAGLRLRKDRPAAIVHDVVPFVEELPKDHPTFTMISARTETRKYGGSEVVIIKYVLMDGSETLVKAATDSCLAKYMLSVDIEVGSTIVVLDYYMVWMEGSHPLEWRSIMVLKKMTWRPPPMVLEVQDKTQYPKYNSCVCKSVVEAVEKECRIVFTRRDFNVDGITSRNKYVIVRCPDEELKNGDWIRDFDTKLDWHYFCNIRKDNEDSISVAEDSAVENSSETEPCGCVSDYGLMKCIVQEYPVTKLDKDELFISACGRLNGEVDGINWRALEPNHKRWCLYWYYAVNVFQIRSSARPLPACLLDHVRNKYPNRDGSKVFKGFLSSSERGVAKHRSGSKRK